MSQSCNTYLTYSATSWRTQRVTRIVLKWSRFSHRFSLTLKRVKICSYFWMARKLWKHSSIWAISTCLSYATQSKSSQSAKNYFRLKQMSNQRSALAIWSFRWSTRCNHALIHHYSCALSKKSSSVGCHPSYSPSSSSSLDWSRPTLRRLFSS